MLTQILCTILSCIFESVSWIQNIFTSDRLLQTFFLQIGLGQILTFSCLAILWNFFPINYCGHNTAPQHHGKVNKATCQESGAFFWCFVHRGIHAVQRVKLQGLSRFCQVIFVSFQWPEPVCCGSHSSWQKVGGVSMTLRGTNKPDEVTPWNSV